VAVNMAVGFAIGAATHYLLLGKQGHTDDAE
jgi:hypothetical protein